jgi:hypothetical protein
MSLGVRRAQLAILQGSMKSFTRSSESGRPVVCSFCPECGTRIMHEPSRAPDMINVRAGTLDDTRWLKPTVELWTSSKQPWLRFGEELASFEHQPE